MEQPAPLIGAINSPHDKSADERQSLETKPISRGTESSNPVPSTGEFANFWFLSGGAPRSRPFASGPEAAAQTPAHNFRRDTVADEATASGVRQAKPLPRGSSCSTWISSESPTYGEQEGSAYNGHFGCTCYHPLFLLNQLGDLERCALRPGNVHSADGRREVLEPVVSRYRGKGTRLYFRGDAAFANPEIYEFLEVEGMGYTIRLPANRVLQDKIGYLLKRPVGRPPHEVRRYYASFGYQAPSWRWRWPVPKI